MEPTVFRPVPPRVVGRVAVEIMFFEALRVSIVDAVRADRVVVPCTIKLPVPPESVDTFNDPANSTAPDIKHATLVFCASRFQLPKVSSIERYEPPDPCTSIPPVSEMI